jgi:mono/diheme cytochrome c family protein
MFKKSLVALLVAAIAVVFTMSAFAAKGDAAKGKTVFATNCAMCHGDAGKGDGAAAAALVPKPRNFTDKALMSKKTDDDLFKVVTKGSPNTGMAPYEKMLSEDDRWNAIAFIRTLAK